MPFLFIPPVALLNPPVLPDTRGVARRLFRYFGAQPVGMSVVYRAGHYVATQNPDQAELATLVQGVTYFLGGHEYWISDAVATALNADGFTIQTTEWSELTGSWGSYATDTWETIG